MEVNGIKLEVDYEIEGCYEEDTDSYPNAVLNEVRCNDSEYCILSLLSEEIKREIRRLCMEEFEEN